MDKKMDKKMGEIKRHTRTQKRLKSTHLMTKKRCYTAMIDYQATVVVHVLP